MTMKIATEAQFQALVLDVARTFGWSTYHTFDARRSSSGWPDLAMWHPARGFMLRELKTDKGKVTVTQTKMIAELRVAGVDVDVWRPADWDRIVAELSAQGRRRRTIAEPPTRPVPMSQPVPPPSSLRDRVRPTEDQPVSLGGAS